MNEWLCLVVLLIAFVMFYMYYCVFIWAN